MGNWYVSSTAVGGGAGTVGDPWTLAEAWTALNVGTVLNGDVVFIKADGTYQQANVSITRSASATSRIIIQGYGTVPGDTSLATIQRTAAQTGTWIDLSAARYLTIVNLEFDANSVGNSAGYGIYGHLSLWFDRIRVKNAKAFSYSSYLGQYLRSEWIDTKAVWSLTLVSCIVDIVDKSTFGATGVTAHNTVFMRASIGASASFLRSCILYDCTFGYGLSSYQHGVINCLFDEMDTACYQANAGSCVAAVSNNYSNYAAFENGGGGYIQSVGGTYVDPLFVDPTNYDFRIQETALEDVGLNMLGLQSTNYGVTPGMDQKRKSICPAAADVKKGTSFTDHGTVETGTLDALTTKLSVSARVIDQGLKTKVRAF